MANSLIFSAKPTHLFSTKPTRNASVSPLHPSLSFGSNALQHKPIRRGFLTPLVSLPYTPINIEYFKEEFGGHGVSFTELGESCVVNMAVENGSMAKLMLPSGLITSYKPRLWHGGSQEVLHTCASSGGEDPDGVVITGGVSLAIVCEGEGGFTWSPTSYALKDIRGNAVNGIEIEIVSMDPDNEVEVKYTVSLIEDSLSSGLKVSNMRSSILELRGSVMSHLNVSTPDATYAVGLEGSNIFNRPPFQSNFSIIPPEVGKSNESLSIFKGLFSAYRNMDGDEESQTAEGEETNNYKHLTDKMSRIYTSAPRIFTIIDRGKRNSVDIGRKGFEEVYMYSPGSAHEWYGEYSYVCVGQAALLRPIRLGPGGVWRGEQQLHNPNI